VGVGWETGRTKQGLLEALSREKEYWRTGRAGEQAGMTGNCF